MNSFFKVEHLCYAYVKKPLCLKDIEFSVGAKDNVLVLGISGSGKSTLIKCISSYDDKYFGTVIINNREIRGLSDFDKNFSLILDKPVLLNSTVDKNLMFLYETLKKENPSENEKVELLKEFGIEKSLQTKTKKLTLVEQFKLCLLRVFVKQPQVIFIDDIFLNNFSNSEIVELLKIIKKISKDCLLFFVLNDKSYIKLRGIINDIEFNKIFYLNNAKLVQRQSIENFESDLIDLDSCFFINNLKQIEAYCVYQDGSYFLCFEEKFMLKIDKCFYDNFDLLKLSNNENEDVIVVCDSQTEIDYAKNNDFNKLIKENKIMIFSKLTRDKIV